MARLVFDPKYQVFCGFHFDIEATAVDRARTAYLTDRLGVEPGRATAAQIAEAAAWAEEEENWTEAMEGVIPLHRCGGHA